MPISETPSGWRKQTPNLSRAERLAQEGEDLAIPKSRAFVAIKKVGAFIGLKPGDMVLLDTLCAFTQAQDWEAGRRPIVWASNAYLMAQTGFSLSALKRHARRLSEIGVIAFKDSPNGKRWGHRDGNGIIVEAYGFDLAPLAARAIEFEALHAHRTAERQRYDQIKRQVTIARRRLRALINTALAQSLPGPWSEIKEMFENLLKRLSLRSATLQSLEQIKGLFVSVQTRAEDAYHDATTVQNRGENTTDLPPDPSQPVAEMTPKRPKTDPHIQTTNQPKSVICRPLCEHRTQATPTDTQAMQPDDSPQALEKPQTLRLLDLRTVIQACPEFTNWAHSIDERLRSWADLSRVAGRLGPMIGIPERVWATAQERLGSHAAAAAIALIFDKFSAGLVVSPGGYLRGMIAKAGSGSLHLERSFFGRLNANRQ